MYEQEKKQQKNRRINTLGLEISDRGYFIFFLINICECLLWDKYSALRYSHEYSKNPVSVNSGWNDALKQFADF